MQLKMLWFSRREHFLQFRCIHGGKWQGKTRSHGERLARELVPPSRITVQMDQDQWCASLMPTQQDFIIRTGTAGCFPCFPFLSLLDGYLISAPPRHFMLVWGIAEANILLYSPRTKEPRLGLRERMGSDVIMDVELHVVNGWGIWISPWTRG